MAFIGQTADPWDVPAKQAVEVMQKIWDVTNSKDYEITRSSLVLQKVCDWFSSSALLINIHFRLINATQTYGKTLLGPPALPLF